MDVGAVWGVRKPLSQDTTPAGQFLPTRDPATGLPLYSQVDTTSLVNNTDGSTTCTITASSSVTSATNSNTLACIPTGITQGINTAQGQTLRFKEFFSGDTWKPRLAIGFGVNWNSPFGPFRIDIAKVLLKREDDDTKTFTFNVGTQF
jgi:outer membrane protein insertion porin family